MGKIWLGILPSCGRSLLMKVLILTALFVHSLAHAGTVRVAVSSNFFQPAKQLGRLFHLQTGHKVVFSPGSTAKLYAQIIQGAPFDLFLAADAKHPKLLHTKKILAKPPLTYATGQAALWVMPTACNRPVLCDGIQKLAIPNPIHAPYGAVARKALINQREWKKWKHKIVYGQNAGQTFSFLKSKNVQAAIVPLSMLLQAQISTNEYVVFDSPIEQQMGLINNRPEVEKFYQFLQQPQTKKILLALGYRENE